MVATYWVAACIGLHAFAMQCESDERADTDSDNPDPFIAEGISSSSDSDLNVELRPPRGRAVAGRLQDAKRRREELKNILFRAKERNARRHARRMEQLD